jgi:hypothetical protein
MDLLTLGRNELVAFDSTLGFLLVSFAQPLTTYGSLCCCCAPTAESATPLPQIPLPGHMMIVKEGSKTECMHKSTAQSFTYL